MIINLILIFLDREDNNKSEFKDKQTITKIRFRYKMKDDPDNYYEDERIIGEEGWEDVDESDVSRTMAQDDVAIAITPSVSEGGSLFTQIEILTCDMIRGGVHIFKKGTHYIIGKFLNKLSNIFISEIGRVFQVWFMNKFNDLVNDMVINIFNGVITAETVNFNLRYIDTIYNYDDIIPFGISLQNKLVEVNSNGEIEVEPDFGYQGLGQVNIITNVPEKRLQSKTLFIEENGFQQVYPDSGYDGLSYVSINTLVTSSAQGEVQEVKQYTMTSVNTVDNIFPDPGYSSMAKVMCSVDVSNLLSSLSLNITSSDLVEGRITLFGNVMQPSIGWSSYIVNVNVSDLVEEVDKTSFRYISLVSGANIPPAALIDLESDQFTGSTSNDLDVTVQEGRTLCIIEVSGNNKVRSIQFVGNPTGTGDSIMITVSKNKYYREMNYDLGSRVYLKNKNLSAILSCSVHSIPNKIMKETDQLVFGLSFISSSDVLFNNV